MAAAQTPLPLPIPDALNAAELALRIPVVLSPDGQWVAYTVQDPRRVANPGDPRHNFVTRTGASLEVTGSDVWVADVHTGHAVNVSAGRGSSWAPAWSPDGLTLAFYSDRSGLAHVWLWDRLTGRLRQLSDAVTEVFYGFEGLRWTPDGRGIVTKVLPVGLSIEQLLDSAFGPPQRSARVAADSPTVTIFRAGVPATSVAASRDASRRDSADKPDIVKLFGGDLAIIDARSGAVWRIARNVRPRGYWVAPDGSQIAYTSILGWGELDDQPYFDVFVVSLRDGTTHLVSHHVPMPYGIGVSWSPDGTRLAYLTGSEGTKANGGGPLAGDCVIARADGSQPVVARALHGDFSTGYRAPLWDPSGRALYVLGADTLWRVEATSGATAAVATVPNHALREIIAPAGLGQLPPADSGRLLFLFTRDDSTRRAGVYRVDLPSGHTTRVAEEDRAYGDLAHIDVTADRRTIVYAAEDAQHPQDLWVANGRFENRHRLTHVAPALDNHVYGATRLLTWRSDDNRPLRGVLLLPAAYVDGQRYPLIVSVYGGALQSNSINQFGVEGAGVGNMQLFATRGYAVLLPDAPIDPARHAPMSEIAKAVLPGVMKAVDIGVADPERLGVMGYSFGGYSTLALLVQSTMFKAAIAGAGVSDMIVAYSEMRSDGSAASVGWTEQGQGDMGGSPWEVRARYLENSPFFYLDRVQTPVLLVHGTLDAAVSVANADQTFVALRRLGREVEYARYEGEGHPVTQWGYANRVDYLQRMLNWFDVHLRSKTHGSVLTPMAEPVGASSPGQ